MFTDKERERETERQSMCMHACMCMCFRWMRRVHGKGGSILQKKVLVESLKTVKKILYDEQSVRHSHSPLFTRYIHSRHDKGHSFHSSKHLPTFLLPPCQRFSDEDLASCLTIEPGEYNWKKRPLQIFSVFHRQTVSVRHFQVNPAHVQHKAEEKSHLCQRYSVILTSFKLIIQSFVM